MIPGGYIIQPRCFDESEAARLPPVTRELWFYLLRKVSHKDNGKFKRGHGFFALEDIQKDLSWMVGYRREMYSKPQLTKSLRRLREGNMIETTKATRGVFVSVCKYDIYQDCKQYEGNDEGRTKGERRENEGTHLKQECKNEKNERTKDKQIASSCGCRPEWFSVSLWDSFIANRKFKKLQNSPLALTAICNKLKSAVDAGFSLEDCVGEYVSRKWQRFDASWMENKQTGNSPSKKDNHNGFAERDYAKDATKIEDIPDFLK